MIDTETVGAVSGKQSRTARPRISSSCRTAKHLPELLPFSVSLPHAAGLRQVIPSLPGFLLSLGHSFPKRHQGQKLPIILWKLSQSIHIPQLFTFLLP